MFRNSRIRSFIKPNEKRRVQKYLSLRQALYYLHLHSNKKKRFRVSLTPFRLNLEVQRNDFFWAFVIGGLICVIGQLMFDVGKLTPAHTMATLVVAGAILDGFNLYEPLIDFAGAGATVPITSFGNALVHGAMEEAQNMASLALLPACLK